jgi:hypothetical protein
VWFLRTDVKLLAAWDARAGGVAFLFLSFNVAAFWIRPGTRKQSKIFVHLQIRPN